MEAYLPEGKRYRRPENSAWLCSADSLLQAKKSGVILEAQAALCDSAHNLSVDLGCMKGLIPREEGAVGIREGTVRDIAILSRVGCPVCFTVQDIVGDGDQPYALLSRADAQCRCIERYIATLCPGDIIPARVTHLEPFGAFCDIGCGVVALMPIDTISVSRIEHPDERFAVGMDIFAVVKSKVGARITLSHKELLGTWEENAAGFAAGETVTGIIRSIENYGAFVELAPNLAGLAELRDDLRVGQRVSVFIKSIIPQKMKVKLIVIAALSDPGELQPPAYFLTAGHLDRFVYSPPQCERIIMTEFEPSFSG